MYSQNILGSNNLNKKTSICKGNPVWFGLLSPLGFQYGSTQHISSFTAFFQRSLNLFISKNDFILTSGLLSTSWDSDDDSSEIFPYKRKLIKKKRLGFKETYTRRSSYRWFRVRLILRRAWTGVNHTKCGKTIMNNVLCINYTYVFLPITLSTAKNMFKQEPRK